jgi:hypothetical protein
VWRSQLLSIIAMQSVNRKKIDEGTCRVEAAAKRSLNAGISGIGNEAEA